MWPTAYFRITPGSYSRNYKEDAHGKSSGPMGETQIPDKQQPAQPDGRLLNVVRSKSVRQQKQEEKTELETYTLTETCHSAAGTDPVAHYNAWRADIGNYNSLYMNGKKWKSNPLKLQKVSFGSVKQDDFGRIRYAVISLTFEEKNQRETFTLTSRVTASKSAKKARKKSRKKKKK